METVAKKLYEAMFLVDSAQAAADWDAVNAAIKSILQRAEAEIVSLKKWADRKLAYEIDHKTRGTYILCYFRAYGGKIRDIERDVQLSERILRVLILSAEKRPSEDIERDLIPASAGTSLPLRKQGQKDGEVETQKDTSAMPQEAAAEQLSTGQQTEETVQ